MITATMSHSALDPQLCTHYKVRKLVRALSRYYDAELAKAGLKATQFTLLTQIVLSAPIALGELADMIGLDASTLSRNIRPLITNEWVTVESSRHDARIRIASATPAGKQKQKTAQECWQKAQQRVIELLGDDLHRKLHKMNERALERLYL